MMKYVLNGINKIMFVSIIYAHAYYYHIHINKHVCYVSYIEICKYPPVSIYLTLYISCVCIYICTLFLFYILKYQCCH